MRDYERELLPIACHQGYGYENGRKLSDFKLLAKLQHHGAATRLIDVSRNMLVALWFECRSKTDQTGILLGWHSNTILGLEGRPEERVCNEIFGTSCVDKEGLSSLPIVW
ncbi:FRG domain-containing protein [Rouxiella sp. T17]|uniref:FRG domain-containing protein n=1 Tax=Rouxiella sp. T17 TaxID=3085684 RepID=UPI002FC5BE0B